ncbi:hypothetical protein [Actinokineospora globicatena]|nr:hypothetical protein [Actinokineospora globicatena]GLW81482.1 hypothetical protein Aglo01_59630 [Actinokineospora globicatena]GLW87820.1 hypothetical protein Aglo02_54590 [Actinokineospora globicatena]
MRLLLVGCLIALSACATPVAGTPVAADVTPVAEDSAEARWMNRFCGLGKLLVTAGETAQQPITSSDPVELKRQFLDVTGRLVGVLDAALADLRALRPSPAPEVDPLIRQLTEAFAESRASIATARDDVRAVETLTVEVFSAAAQRLTTALGGLERAVKLLKAAQLPPALVAATDAAPNCR